MGMRVGTSNNTTIRKILKYPDGTTAGTITITKPKNKYMQRKKRLPYNYKKISNQILQSKTPDSAQQTVGRARRMVASLKRKLRSSEYDDTELKNAIIHAEKMVRIAKKRKKHIDEEERAKRTGAYNEDAVNEKEESVSENEEAAREQEARANEEKLRKLEQELKELMEETMEETVEETMSDALKELADGLIGAAHTHMDKEDVERLKKRHRNDELREIIEADMKYLKALFEQMAKEKQAAMSGQSSSAASADSGNSGSVSLELGGVDMPVETSEVPVQVEGASVDVSV